MGQQLSPPYLLLEEMGHRAAGRSTAWPTLWQLDGAFADTVHEPGRNQAVVERGERDPVTAARTAGPLPLDGIPMSWRRRFRPVTGREPSLQVPALDLYRSLEFQVGEISAVAGGVDGGLRDLQQLCDL